MVYPLLKRELCIYSSGTALIIAVLYCFFISFQYCGSSAYCGSTSGSSSVSSIVSVSDAFDVSDVAFVSEAFSVDTTEALSKLKSEDGAIAVLPQPFVTAASAQISGLRVVMDLNEAWEKINNNSKIVTGVIVVRKEFAEKYPEQLKKFIDEYNESVAYTSSNIDETAQLIAEYGIVASEAIAKKALPKCHIVCYINNNMRSALEGFLQVLYDQNPKSVGGSMPKDDFYYEY